MRDRLIEMLKEAHESWLRYVDDCAFNQMALSFTFEQMFADHLLANGVIVPPCKVGDDIYWIDEEQSEIVLEKSNIKAVCYYGDNNFKVVCGKEKTPEDIGTRWCMLTKAEAEQALEKMKGEKE